jgi:hypothetical protein
MRRRSKGQALEIPESIKIALHGARNLRELVENESDVNKQSHRGKYSS